MAYSFLFVGIDRYADPRIRELAGAANDARALWALFADTFPAATAKLLVNDQAVVSTVRTSLQAVLRSATGEDIVVVFFGGHGTRDHQLVLFDTDRSALPSTTLSMQEIADLFHETQARVALLILDCCFSGGVTARVIEDSPISRDAINPLADVSGEGRVIITASNFNEPAYEMPGRDHGLLTKALIEAFEAEAQTNILALMSRVMDRVRAEAARIGVEQTPSFYGDIQGGVIIPRLVRGNNYAQLFPGTAQRVVTCNLHDLSVFGLPDEILDQWEQRYPHGLNELQLTSVNERGLLAGRSLLVIAPTSAGKTFIGEMAAAKAVVENRKAVFLLPYRALVNEKHDQFLQTYGSLGMRVIRCTGDYTDHTELLVRGKYDLALLTYEMFLSLAVSVPAILQQLGLVVLDEAQFITDPNRGITVELLLTHLVAARSSGIVPQVIALSAVIGDANRFHEWLGTGLLRTERRPVPLTEGVLDRSGIFYYADDHNEIQKRTILDRYQIVQRNDKPGAQDVLVPLIRKLVSAGQKILVFRNMRGKAEGCANYLSNDLGLPPDEEGLKELRNQDPSAASASLRRCLQGGTAFHNSNLTREEKEVVERSFRDPSSPLKVLVATTTVAAGINTPASTAIIAEQTFVGEDGREFTVAEYKNMAGRAGRLGFNEEGTSIILAQSYGDTAFFLNHYVRGALESLHSSFERGQLETWLIRLLAQVRSAPRNEVAVLLANTYGGYLATQNDPAWTSSMFQEVNALLTRMLALGLAEEDGGNVQLTLLGRACGRSPLSLPSALRLIELLRSVTPDLLQPMALIAIMQVLPESEGGYTPLFKRGNRESARVQDVVARFAGNAARILQRNAADMFDYWGRCKRASILADWIRGVGVDVIEQTYSVTPFQGKISHGDIRRFADSTRWCLRSVHEILTLLFPDLSPHLDEIDMISRSLEVGLPREALPLLDLPLQLSRGEYLALYRNGMNNVEKVKGAPAAPLIEILGEQRSAALRARFRLT
jgi:replicative superfamily II helicase